MFTDEIQSQQQQLSLLCQQVQKLNIKLLINAIQVYALTNSA